MKLVEAFNKAALLGSLAQVKRVDTGRIVTSTDSFSLEEVSTESWDVVVPKFSKELFANVWDRTKPSSSPVAAENQFFARIVNELDNLGMFDTVTEQQEGAVQ